MPVPLLVPQLDWSCPNCWTTCQAPPLPPGQAKMHTCPGLHMLAAPLIPAGTRCKVEAVERPDYLAGEIQRTGDDGKPYMAVVTTRDDGQDAAVNAGLARGRLSEAFGDGAGLIGFGP